MVHSYSCNDALENGICYTTGGINHIVRKRTLNGHANLKKTQSEPAPNTPENEEVDSEIEAAKVS